LAPLAIRGDGMTRKIILYVFGGLSVCLIFAVFLQLLLTKTNRNELERIIVSTSKTQKTTVNTTKAEPTKEKTIEDAVQYLSARHNVLDFSDGKVYSMRIAKINLPSGEKCLLIEVQNERSEWHGEGKYEMRYDDGSKMVFHLNNSKLDGMLTKNNPIKKITTTIQFRDGCLVGGFVKSFDNRILCFADYKNGKCVKSHPMPDPFGNYFVFFQ
jgi:hypothetical protein